ncbi:hypothetical protein [Streptomyces sp. NBC_00091]|uniref:hypothetical protein n=1 Tax=Streptomyces sp. NBC_00091 TaxID=2975648 RepID=UPI00224FE938|nr:hypothetical protein [Streptomyces sp. NBC_00091]MCX5379705.1 hypothetical protein [Streptomyces sp. NBC_00091]
MTTAGNGTTGGAAAPRTVRRLRPGVAVTPLRAGLHLRGRGGAVTLEGSTALPALWQWLEEPLRGGGLEDLLDGTEPGSALRGAVRTLLGQLEAHDLLVAQPEGYGDDGRAPVARWLAASAGRPAGAAAALGATRAEVVAGAPDGALARAAGRALELGGLPVGCTADPALPAGRVLLHAHGAGPPRAVAAGLSGGNGYATAPGSPAQARSDAAALEARLGPGEAAGPPALPSLLGGAAAHRLLCAAAGLADPAGEGGDERLLPGLPAVLLAGSGPLRADYRTWLGPGRIDADRRADLAPADTLGEVLRRLAALGDERCGALPAPRATDLRQLPVPLAACELPGDGPAGGRLVAGAPRLDLARLEVFCRAAELLLGDGEFTVGANPGHAWGRALRSAVSRSAVSRSAVSHRAVSRRAGAPGGDAPPLAAPRWSGHPQFRHWWTTLTARLEVPARLEVRRAGPDEVYHAVVRRAGESPVLGEAVEATPGDAAAFAALAAVAEVSALSARGPGTGRTRPSGGAVAPLAAAGARTAGWEDAGWTDRWMADAAGREEAFQDALSRLAGPAREAGTPAPAGDRELPALLRAFGFTVLHTLHTPEEP